MVSWDHLLWQSAFFLLHQICQIVIAKIALALKKDTVGVFLDQVANAQLKHVNVEKIVNVGITALAEAIVVVNRLIQSCILEVLMKITFLKCNYKNKCKLDEASIRKLKILRQLAHKLFNLISYMSI